MDETGHMADRRGRRSKSKGRWMSFLVKLGDRAALPEIVLEPVHSRTNPSARQRWREEVVASWPSGRDTGQGRHVPKVQLHLTKPPPQRALFKTLSPRTTDRPNKNPLVLNDLPPKLSNFSHLDRQA